MSAKDIAKYNADHYGTSMVLTSGSSTHFMSGETWMILLEQLISPALKMQRELPLIPCRGYIFVFQMSSQKTKCHVSCFRWAMM